jgi:gamma-polyglutamate biosynthesis protein CapC
MAFETLLIGLVIALVYTETTGISPGGLIVPGYMALFLDQPLRILATFVVAILSLVLFRALSGRYILFGRRRFVLLILLGTVLAQGWTLAMPGLLGGPTELRVIGWVIPGLLANSLERQKFAVTTASLATVSVLTYFLVRLVSWL